MKLVHTAITAGDFEHSIRFYQKVFRMELVWKGESTDGRALCAFLKSMDSSHAIELIYWREGGSEEKLGLDHIGFEVSDLDKVLASVVKNDATILRGPHFSRIFKANCASVADPSGVKVELIERK